VTVMKALAFEDPDFIKAKEEQIAAYAYRKSVEAVYNGVERDHTQVSRELTRRLSRGDRERRANRSNL